ncbi:HPF/RaiA family ribosome-associated protein [Streptomyces sp. NPDC097704]|uniref:ribosome hibernation promotion factor n=1 Tax=Streptomyces sp. NPDC097704 TaxID=3157101 RepID=UPI00331FF0D1
MNRVQTRSTTDVVVETRGPVSMAAPDYARAKLAAVLERLDEPVLAARVKLIQEANRAVDKPSLAQAVVNLNGRPVRAHVAASTMQEAVDLLQDRLTTRLDRFRHHGDRHGRHAVPPAGPGFGPGAWHDGGRHEHRPQRRTRNAEGRRIVRHESYSLARRTGWAAVLELEAMDYDFHLFTDAVTGCDSVVYRDHGKGGHRLASVGQAPEPEPGLSVSTAAVPELTVADAVLCLDLVGRPFVFFTDTVTGRGNVLYHRYDGHYGLITPAR